MVLQALTLLKSLLTSKTRLTDAFISSSIRNGAKVRQKREMDEIAGH